MSTTNAALDWLLSLSATFTSSPIPNSDPPDFTDWLHVSPTTSSPTSAPLSSSPPFQDVTCSSRINLQQDNQDLGLNYLYDLSGYFNSDITASSGSQNSCGARDGNLDSLLPTSVQAPMFSEHHRMASLDSSTATLVNTPSPRFHIFAPAQTGTLLDEHEHNSRSPFFSSSFCSPATKLIEDLQNASFGSLYSDMAVSSLSVQATADVSPVVRAADTQGRRLASDDKTAAPKPKSKRSKTKKHRRSKPAEPALSFVQKLHAVEAPSKQQLPLEVPQETSEPLPLADSSLPERLATAPEYVLLSPCRLIATQPSSVHCETTHHLPILPALQLANPISVITSDNDPSTPPQATKVEALSPLTPLPSLPSTPNPVPPLKIVLKLKRELSVDDKEPSVRRSKRPRKTVVVVDSPSPSPSYSRSPSPSASFKQEGSGEDNRTTYTTRTLPSTIEVSDNFPLFYRRFPASSYYQQDLAASPCTLFGVPNPGGNYNPPRNVLDLYTPRFVKGRGAEKVGLCPICIESPARGGEKKKLWLAMKFSAFNYHMQYAHGISAATGLPFSPPIAFRIVPRVNPGKKEKTHMQQGKCHKCKKWIAVEGIKDMESKVKELYWWKHAAACHHESTLEGEGDYYEEDDVLATLVSLPTLTKQLD